MNLTDLPRNNSHKKNVLATFSAFAKTLSQKTIVLSTSRILQLFIAKQIMPAFRWSASICRRGSKTHAFYWPKKSTFQGLANLYRIA
jgi:hypothetical protein